LVAAEHEGTLSTKTILPFVGVMILGVLGIRGSMSHAETPTPSVEPKLTSTVFALKQLPVETRSNGVRRAVFDAPTATLDRLHAHITTLEPGEKSGEPRLHPQEEVIIVTEGTIEANFDGQKREASAGSVIFFASNATTFLRNPGPKPATYYVVYYRTPLTPKG
jgi:quercetin dioxygenase-like cupin family protein